MYKRNFFDVYIQEKYNLDTEWYNMQKNLIYSENRSLVDKLPVVVTRSILDYIYGAESYFGKMYDIIKTEWNHFYVYYKNHNRLIKRERDNIVSLKEHSSVYGIKYNINSSSIVAYDKLSPTDGFINLNLHTLNLLTPSTLGSYSNSLSTSTIDNIRGTMLRSNTISQEDFKNNIYKFYCENNSTARTLLDDNYIDNIPKFSTTELLRVKNEIDIFYTGVLSFINEINHLISSEGKDKLSSISSNTDQSSKILRKYYHIKTVEFREFAQIYNVYFLTLLTVYRDKIKQDAEIIERG